MKKIGFYLYVFLFIIVSTIVKGEILKNKQIVTQTFLSYQKQTGEQFLAVSNYVKINVNEIVAFEVNNFFPTIDLQVGEQVEIPYSIINNGNFSEKYILYIKNPDIFSNYEFYLDINKNGVLDIDETMLKLNKIGESSFELPLIEIEDFKNIILRGQLRSTLDINNIKLEFKIQSFSQSTIEKDITNTLNIYSKRQVDVRKGIYFDSIKNQYYFTFKFLNESLTPVKKLYLEDDIDPNFKMSTHIGLWQDFRKSEKENVTFFLDGYEEKIPKLNVSLINGKLKVEIEDIPSQNKTDVGGVLFIPFYIEDSFPEDNQLRNIAKYSYTLNNIVSESYLTNEVIFFKSYTPLLEQKDRQKENLVAVGDKYIFEITSKVTNNGNGADTYNVLIKNSNFPGEVILTNLNDTNGDGILDTGQLNIGETKEIVIRGSISKEDINNSYSLNLLFNSLKVNNYSMSIVNFFNLKVDSSKIKFLKEHRTVAGKYTVNLIDIRIKESIYYKLTLENEDTEFPLILSEVYDNIPEGTKISYGTGNLEEGGRPVYKIGENGKFNEINLSEGDTVLKLEDITIPPGEKMIIYFNVEVF